MVISIAISPLALSGSGSVLGSEHLQLLSLQCHLLLETLDWKSVSRYKVFILAVFKGRMTEPSLSLNSVKRDRFMPHGLIYTPRGYISGYRPVSVFVIKVC